MDETGTGISEKKDVQILNTMKTV